MRERPLISAPAATVLGLGLLLVLVLPVAGLLLSSSPRALANAFAHPMVGPSLSLTLRTTLCSLAVAVATGTPLAWFLARRRGAWVRVVETLVELPIVLPPAVVGIGLLLAFGREGLLGPILDTLGWSVPFSTSAVVLAQVVVATPFYVQSATAGFRRVDEDLLLVARTLGASPRGAFFRVAVPAALGALVSGAALCWARAVGEFGATLLFAGNLPGRTQTMPVAIYSALETDVHVATAIALILAGVAFATLLTVRAGQRAFGRFRPRGPR